MIQLDIVLKMGDCEKQMTMDEARNLYSELNRLFNNGASAQPQQRLNIPQTKPTNPNEHPQVTAAREAAAKRTSGCSGCGGNKKKTTEVKPTRAPAKRAPTKEKDK